MNKRARQERDTNVSISGAQPALSFSQMMDVLVRLYRARPQEVGKLTARVKKVQRSGIPVGSGSGKGRLRYPLDHFFQMLLVLELAELSISLASASELVRQYWPGAPLSLAPAHAWLMHLDGDEDTLLVIARVSERAGFVGYSSDKEAATAQAGAFIVGAKTRPWDGLSPVLLSRILSGKRLDLSGGSWAQTVWRSSLIDFSTLIPVVVGALEETRILGPEDFTAWARGQCETFDLSLT